MSHVSHIDESCSGGWHEDYEHMRHDSSMTHLYVSQDTIIRVESIHIRENWHMWKETYTCEKETYICEKKRLYVKLDRTSLDTCGCVRFHIMMDLVRGSCSYVHRSSYSQWYSTHHTATHCNTLQQTASHRNTLQHPHTVMHLALMRDMTHSCHIWHETWLNHE